jgi:hypothetical protein
MYYKDSLGSIVSNVDISTSLTVYIDITVAANGHVPLF